VISRIVFDTNTVLSALLFPNGRLSWLRIHWAHRQCIPLISTPTAEELIRVLAYPKFHLAERERLQLLRYYLPFCEVIEKISRCPEICRDPHDQVFLDLAHSGAANVLVTGDKDLLSLREQTNFHIETPEVYRSRVEAPGLF
jgi:putative PIN family toxin of toxin-antitoxin system